MEIKHADGRHFSFYAIYAKNISKVGTLRFICSSLGNTTHVKFFCTMCYKIHGDL